MAHIHKLAAVIAGAVALAASAVLVNAAPNTHDKTGSETTAYPGDQAFVDKAAKGGLKELSVGAFTAYDLSGDFRDGGFMIGIGAQYGRLQGSAAKTPITSIRGDADQWVAGGGVAYGF